MTIPPLHDAARWDALDGARQAKVTLIRNKADLSGENIALEVSEDGHVTISLSARSTEGLDLLREHLKACMGYEQTSESSFSARRRHLEALQHASHALEHGRAQLTLAGAGELLAKCGRLNLKWINPQQPHGSTRIRMV